MRALIPNSTQIPDVLLDLWMARLSGAEFKVVMYIARRTYGFGKESDTISLSQLSRGIRRRDGYQLDHGTGLGLSTVKAACVSLTASGILIKTAATVAGSSEPDQSTYRLNLYAAIETEAKENQGKAGEVSSEGSGSVLEVGQESAYLGQKPAYLENDAHNPPEVGQKLAGVGQESARGRPENKRQVGQNLATQETEQETEEQETATTDEGRRDDGIVVALSPSAREGQAEPSAEDPRSESETLLRAAGFSAAVARALSHHAPEGIRRQVEALPKRKAGKNPLGMLRKAIEEGWDIPKSAEETAREHDAKRQGDAKAREEAHSASERARGIQTLQRLESDAPEAYSAFLAFMAEQKERAQRSAVAKGSERFRASLEALYDSDEKRVELLPQFVRSFGKALPGVEALVETAR